MYNAKNDATETDLLYTIGQIFSSSADLKEQLDEVLSVTAKHYKMKRGMITVSEEETFKMVIDASYGYTASEVRRGIYKPGEGIIGKVFDSGKPVVIPIIKEEPEFLNKTGARRDNKHELAFICVPINMLGKTIGTISVDIINDDFQDDFSKELKTLSTIAIMISHSVKYRINLRAQERNYKAKLTQVHGLDRMVGDSRTMHDLYEKILMVSPTNSTVIITGESGTGKELVADAVHKNSNRKDFPYIKVNIAALPENLIESELFGHEKGAFTGALSAKKGRFELANGGTIFLDEIGDLSYPLQVKLLRVLQERTIERLGSNKSIPLDVRIITATHQDLESKIVKGEFRQDLFYRLNVFPIHVVPLRERKADILSMADYFLEKYSREFSKKIKRISTEAIDMLTMYHWPGNVRELENCIQRSVIVSNEEVIRSYHLPSTLQMADETESSPKSLEEMTNLFQKEIIIDHLKITRGNITKASQLLGTTKRILTYKVNHLGIDYSLYKKK